MQTYQLDSITVDNLLAPLNIIRRELRQGDIPRLPHPEKPGVTLCLEEFQVHATSVNGDLHEAAVAVTKLLEEKKAKVPNATTFFFRSASHALVEPSPISSVRNHMIAVGGAFGYCKEDEELLDPMRQNIKHGTHVDFGTAIRALELGYRVRRAEGWNGKGMFLYLVPGSEFVVNRAPLSEIFPEGTTIKYQPHIDMYNAQGMCVPWAPSQSDQLAKDWVVLPRKVGDDA